MTGQQIPDSQIDEMLDSKASDVFYRQLNPISVEGRMAIEDATNRHNEILQIEQSISELQEIFEDIFELVHQQVITIRGFRIHYPRKSGFGIWGDKRDQMFAVLSSFVGVSKFSGFGAEPKTENFGFRAV